MMNVKKSCLSPNTLRRCLTIQGRSTTADVFDTRESNNYFNSDTAKKQVTELLKHKMGGPPQTTGDGLVGENPSTKTAEEKENKATPLKPSPSLDTFYTRDFKRLRGNQAWESAMRDLGSRDTLLNRYGYVRPRDRGETHHKPRCAGSQTDVTTANPDVTRFQKRK